MENEILKQWQRDYPSIPADVLAKLAGFLETVCGGDAAQRSELVTASADAMAMLSERFSASAQAEAQVAKEPEFRFTPEQGRATQAEFVQALSKELTDRGVPEAFWKAALEVDTLQGEVVPSADAIQAGYKAYLQQQADEKVAQQPRPQQATQTPKVSPAVENYLRSLRSDSPLAGKLKG